MNKPAEIVDAVIKYVYNTDPESLCRMVYLNNDPFYISSKIQDVSNFTKFWGGLDNGCRERLVEMAMDKYM